MRRRTSMARIAIAGLTALSSWFAGAAAATDLGPIRIVWPYPAGGDVDGVLRLMAEYMSKDAGRPFIVDNRNGAAGLIAMQAVASAPSDGSTMLAAPMGTMALLPHTKKLSLNPLETFVPVCQFAETSGYVFAGKHLGFKSFADLVTYGRKHPGKLTYASSGIGTQVHLMGEMLQRQLGIKMLHIPYKGPIEAMTDLSAGRLDLMFEPAALPYARMGKMDVLASLTDKRPPDMPNLPTAKDLHLTNLTTSWFGLFVRKEVPKEDIANLEKLCSQAVNNSTLQARMKNFQAQSAYKPGNQLATTWATDYRTQGELLRSLNLKLDN